MSEQEENQFSHRNLSNPARHQFAITPDDNADLPVITRSIYVGGAGDVNFIAVDDSAPVVWKAVPAGTIIPVQAIRVMADGTTATDIIGLY